MTNMYINIFTKKIFRRTMAPVTRKITLHYQINKIKILFSLWTDVFVYFAFVTQSKTYLLFECMFAVNPPTPLKKK